MPDTFLTEIHEAFQEIGGEIRSEGSEFDFRYSLVGSGESLDGVGIDR